jgi:hypothetical protein
MFKNMLQLRNKMARGDFTVRHATNNLFMRQMPKRMFSETPINLDGININAIIRIGLGTAGLSYMMYYGR